MILSESDLICATDVTSGTVKVTTQEIVNVCKREITIKNAAPGDIENVTEDASNKI